MVSVTSSAGPRHLSGAGHEWDQGTCQVRAWVGDCSTCQVLIDVEPQRLSGAGSCSACQVLVYGDLTVLVRCWFMGTSQCLSGAGLWGPHSACQVLVHGELTVLVRCWFMGSSQRLSGAGLWGPHSACQVLVYGDLTALVRRWHWYQPKGSGRALCGRV